jgi:TolB-like protein/cytochrome c-type biogenesis protein CcmH/NrfG
MPTEELESDKRSSAAPASKPAGRRATLQRIGTAIAWFAGVGAILGGLAGYWSTYRTVTTELLAPPAPKPMTSQPSIVVLPFTNVGGDARLDYLADGITDSLSTDLSHALPGSFIVSRDTAFTYKGKPTDVRQIGRELNVRYALAGSVFTNGEKLRVNAELVDAKAGAQLWAERFDIAQNDILQAQDEIVGRLARAIGLRVTDVEARRSERERPKSTDATDLVMRGKEIANRPSSAETMIGARDLYEQALKVEPDNIDALAGVATTLVFEVLNGYYGAGNEQRLHQAEALLARTLAVEPRHLVSLKARAALLRAQGKFEDGIAAAQAVIAENPGEPWAYKEVGLSTMYVGDAEEALDWFAKAERLGPRDPGRWTWLDGRGHALILLGRHEEAARSLRAALDSNPNNVGTYALLASAYALGGLADKSRLALAEYQKYHPHVTVGSFRLVSPVPLKLTSQKYQQQFRRLKEGLRKAGMPG